MSEPLQKKVKNTTYVILLIMGEDFGYGCQAKIDRETWDTFGVTFWDLIGHESDFSVREIQRKCKMWVTFGDLVWNKAAGWESITDKEIYTTQEDYPGSVFLVWSDVE